MLQTASCLTKISTHIESFNDADERDLSLPRLNIIDYVRLTIETILAGCLKTGALEV